MQTTDTLLTPASSHVKISEKDIARFWAKVDKKSESECWLWTGAKSKSGYGKFWAEGKDFRAHRVSWVLANGEIEDGLQICHKCDVRLCCNPLHAFKGTQKDNMSDAKSKGRTATGDRSGRRLHPENYPTGDRHYSRLHPEALLRGERHWTKHHPGKIARGDFHGSRLHPELVPRGESNGASKLLESDIVPIRRLRIQGFTYKEIGNKYGVAICTIFDVIKGITWKHVKEADVLNPSSPAVTQSP